MLERADFLRQIGVLFRSHPAVAILGPRQCGKTTLAREFVSSIKVQEVHYFDLEDPEHLNRLADPKLALEGLEGLILIDEVQRMPDLFPLLRVLIDHRPQKQEFLILGSASRDLIRQSSETLAGRIAYLELPPFTSSEADDLERLWLRGGFPPSYLAERDSDSVIWRKNYITNFLERDVPMLGISINAERMRRLWMMLTHLHGRVLNASELARALDISQPSVKRYLEILSGTFLIRLLQPWFANIGKRQVKSPKVYFRDSGLLHSFLNLECMANLRTHPAIGSSWEGFALEQVVHLMGAESRECYFWAKHSQAELDLLIARGSGLEAFEFKYSSAPKITRSMHSVFEDLGVERITVVTPGTQSYRLSEKVWVTNLTEMVGARSLHNG